MKISACTAFIIGLLSFATNVARSSPLLSIGESANLFFDGSSSLIWQSNVFYDDKIEKDELMLVMSPGLEANVGNESSIFDALFRATYEMQRLDKFSKLNDNYWHLNTIVSYDGARLDVNVTYSFDEDQTTAGEQGGIGTNDEEFIKLNVTRARLQGTYILSPKFSFESGIYYYDREYKDEKDRFADVESYSIPADIFYELTPKVDLSLGYEYSFEEVGVSNVLDYHRESSFFNVGARGLLFPKLNGFFKVGYRVVNPEGPTRETDQNLGISADLTYLATPKLTSKLSLSRGFGVGSEGQSTENTSARLELNYAISGNYSANFYTDLIYQDFKDGNEGKDFINRSGFRILYSPNPYWRFSTGYSYVENDSNRTGQGYVNDILDVSASLRY